MPATISSNDIAPSGTPRGRGRGGGVAELDALRDLTTSAKHSQKSHPQLFDIVN